ncbi:MAG: ADP-ribosylglycohydrolase family protein [Candidatus Schekmanbacteria bacterium]|nr:ADP-ribosylglycohydrolase family protein [Candidatus Schekmanbacteria bacterium]
MTTSWPPETLPASPARPYARALQVATDAALAAGAVLRAEFHRPDGPRGSGGSCPADEEVEAGIRAALSAVSPDWGYLGEELGAHAGPGGVGDGVHLWLVDPNDGTTSFIQKRRGAAVSIALLRAGVPVLGVVYAYAAPDDSGDLFAWAEGEGPLRRNGTVIERGPFAEALLSHHLVWVSQDADRSAASSRLNAELCAPARFRPIPSIAYRLALVAAGDGEAAVSLNHPCGWDYAAGHALLRAAGGELCDESGAPVRYAVRGHSAVGRCFGGGPGPTRVLSRRNWHQVFEVARDSAPETPFALLVAPRHLVADAGRLGRAHGCLLGQLAGDALGSLVEFQGRDSIAAAYPGGLRNLADGGAWNTIAGQPTDDSELALALARSLEQSHGFDIEAVGRAYAYWYRSNPFDIGTTTATGLSAAAAALLRGDSAAAGAQQAARAASAGSQANGALMRSCPLGIRGAEVDPDVLAGWARADAALTHPHPVCCDSSALFVVAIAFAIAGGPTPREVYERALTWGTGAGLEEAVLAVVRTARDERPRHYSQQMGWVLIALQNAFYQLLHAPDLESGVVDTVMRGGDTDTNGAIAGALLGAVHGRRAIPPQWRDLVLSCRPVNGAANVHHPRPRAFWPVDALTLAEALLAPRPNDPSTPGRR